ncbi:MAG: heme-binding protein [Pseudolabrys sp.]
MHVADSKNSRGLALTTTLSTAVAAQGLVTQKNISLAMAPTIAQAAVAQCESMGFKVSVTVVDPAGLPIVMLRGDGAGLHTPEGAERKAHTARTFSQPSADFVKRLTERPETVGSRQYTRVLALAGGLPIKAGSEVVGAVGVSGSPGKDDVGSQAGIDKVADQLK